MLSLSPLLGAKGEKRRPADSAGKAVPSYDLPQPENETIDYNAYQRIRKEGTTYSHVMEYAAALMDAIGSRLTGSPNAMRANEWTRDQLKAMGCTNAHLEDWGEFGTLTAVTCRWPACTEALQKYRRFLAIRSHGWHSKGTL